jgi:hypothetical protein
VLGAPTQFGAAFVAFGGLFFWLFAWNADVSSLWRFRGELATAPGTVLACRDTHVSQGKGRRARKIYACDYEFHVDRATLRGTSYGHETRVAQEVTIELRRDDPTISRVQGMRAAPFDPFAAIAAIFPLVGVLVMAGGIWSGLSAVNLLRDGVATRARLVAKEVSSVRVNRRRVVKMTFRFQDDSGVEHTHVERTTPLVPITDDHEELLLYDPLRPERAVLVGSIWGSPRFGETGEVEPASSLALGQIVLPAIAVAANVVLSQIPFFR